MKDQQLRHGRFRAGLLVTLIASSGVLAASIGSIEAAHATTSRSPSPHRPKLTSKHVVKDVVRSGIGDEAFGEWEEADESYLHDLARSYSRFTVQLRSGDHRTYTVTGGNEKDGRRVITVTEGTLSHPTGNRDTMDVPEFQDWLDKQHTSAIVMREPITTPEVRLASVPATLEGRAKEIYDYLNNPNSPGTVHPNVAKLNGLTTSYSPTQAKIFNYLIGNPGKTYSEIKEGARLSKNTVVATLPSMMARGLIVRVKDYIGGSNQYIYSVVETLPVLEYSR